MLGLLAVLRFSLRHGACLVQCRLRIDVSRPKGIRQRAVTTEREITMLVLSRKLGEKIVIGDNIIVTVVKIDRNQIRLGIEAPHEVPVYREEIAPNRANKPVVDAEQEALAR